MNINNKILIRFRPVGNARILKCCQYEISSKTKMSNLISFLRTKLVYPMGELNIYLQNNSDKGQYYPNDNISLLDLLESFGEEIYISESKPNIKILNVFYIFYDKVDRCCPDCNWTQCDCDLFKDFNAENILLNLKILSKLKPYDKLINISSDNFQIDIGDYLQSFRRWYMGRDRTSNLCNLESFLNQLHKYLKLIYDYPDSINKFPNQQIINESLILENGLQNLKLSYQEDFQCIDRISKIISIHQNLINPLFGFNGSIAIKKISGNTT